MQDKIVFPSSRTETLRGPLQSPAPMPASYSPVDCDFSDDLEFLSVKKIEVEVSHWSEASNLEKTVGLINDITIEEKIEFLFMSNGDKIRLDRISQLRILN